MATGKYDDVNRIAREYLEVSEKIKQLDKIKEDLRANLLTMLGPDEAMNTGLYRIMRMDGGRVSLDTTLLKKSEPSLYEKFSKISQVTTLKVSKS